MQIHSFKLDRNYSHADVNVTAPATLVRPRPLYIFIPAKITFLPMFALARARARGYENIPGESCGDMQLPMMSREPRLRSRSGRPDAAVRIGR